MARTPAWAVSLPLPRRDGGGGDAVPQDDRPLGESPLPDAPAATTGKLPSLADKWVVARIPRERGVAEARLLGEGGEGLAFAYDAGRVIKIYKRTTIEYLRRRQALQTALANAVLPFATPAIFEVHRVGDVHSTVERRLYGRPLDERLATLPERDARRALAAFFDALPALHAVALPDDPYSQLLPMADQVRAATWPAFLLAKLEQRARVSWPWLSRDVSRLGAKLRGLQRLIAALPAEPRKALVHGDFNQDNVLLDDDLAISAVLDFSVYTVVGDHRLDVACVVFFPEVSPVVRPGDLAFLRARAAGVYGGEIEDAIRLYRPLYAFYNADNFGHNPVIYAKCIEAIANAGLE